MKVKVWGAPCGAGKFVLVNTLAGPNRNLIRNPYSSHRKVGNLANVEFLRLHPAVRRKSTGVCTVRILDDYHDSNTSVALRSRRLASSREPANSSEQPSSQCKACVRGLVSVACLLALCGGTEDWVCSPHGAILLNQSDADTMPWDVHSAVVWQAERD